MEETAKILDKWAGKLAELVQKTAPEVWEMTARGVVAEAVSDAVSHFLWLCLCTWVSVKCWKVFDSSDAAPLPFGFAIASGIVAAVMAVSLIGSINSLVVALWATDYAVLHKLLELAR